MYYPLLVDLQNIHIAIVGAGQVGQRKLFSLIPCSFASIALYDPHFHEKKQKTLTTAIEELCKSINIPMQETRKKIHFYQRNFEPEDSSCLGLLFAATNNTEVNGALAKLCHEKKILCNIADNEQMSNVIVPAVIRQEGITISISTNGYSPALTKRLKSDIENCLGNKYSKLSVLMKRIRDIILASSKDSHENAHLFRHLVASSLAEHLNDDNYRMAIQELRAILPDSLHTHIGDLLNDL